MMFYSIGLVLLYHIIYTSLFDKKKEICKDKYKSYVKPDLSD